MPAAHSDSLAWTGPHDPRSCLARSSQSWVFWVMASWAICLADAVTAA